jgi:hypothetical protein
LSNFLGALHNYRGGVVFPKPKKGFFKLRIGGVGNGTGINNENIRFRFGPGGQKTLFIKAFFHRFGLG